VLDELRTHGLHFSDHLGAKGSVPARALDLSDDAAAARDASLVLVCVKSGATDAAGVQLAAILRPDAVVASLQNGVRNAETLARRLPRHTVLAGMVPFNVVPLGAGRFHQATEGTPEVAAHPAWARWRIDFERAGLPLHERADMPAVLWGKLLVNLANPVNALAGVPVQAMLAQRDYRRCIALAQAEALRVLGRAGLRAARMTPLPPRWLPRLLAAPDLVFRPLARRMMAIDPHARTSMAYDLERGRPTEIDWINGEVVRLAQAVGAEAPVNAKLVALMHAAESGTRRSWDAAALRAELASA
jgi:2-dehydropantoate 2-reductase